jgi:hypothetical protein
MIMRIRHVFLVVRIRISYFWHTSVHALQSGQELHTFKFGILVNLIVCSIGLLLLR